MNSKFVVLMEWVDNLEDLTWSQKGKMFQAFIDFNKNGEVNITDKMVRLAWNFIEPNVIRMSEKYQRDVENGKKGGRPKKPALNPSVTQTKPPDNLNETYKYKHNHKQKQKYKHKEKQNDKENHKEDTGTDISSGTGLLNQFDVKDFQEPFKKS